MARITVEDCIGRVSNRYELALLAAERARQIGAGEPLTVEAGDEHRAVAALREIAAGTVDLGHLRERRIERLLTRRSLADRDEPQEDSFVTHFVSPAMDTFEEAANEEREADTQSDAA